MEGAYHYETKIQYGIAAPLTGMLGDTGKEPERVRDDMSTIAYLTTILFDVGAVGALPDRCGSLGISRPLVVTDAGVRAAGLLARLSLPIGTPVFDRTTSNPREATVREAVEIYRAHACDGVIGFGGGSSLDLAKAVALAATHPGGLWQFALIEGGLARITPAVAPVIAIPTTAGTGSEVGRAAVIILDDGRKVGLISPHMIPRLAICDPELTYGLPPHLTAATGMDAITHCFETFLAPAFNPPADGIALDGLHRGWRAIETAVSTPRDARARRDMMSASMQGALAFQKGLGAVHSLSHAIGGLRPDLHHGELNAALLPHVIRFNARAGSVVAEGKIERLAFTIGVEPTAAALAAAVGALTARLGLTTRLRDFGLSRMTFGNIIALAMKDHCHATNPRIATVSDYDRILNAAL